MPTAQKPRGLVCTISGEVPKSPVVSLQSGLLFERRLIEKAISTNGGRCPETGTPLTTDDLLPVRTSDTVPPVVHGSVGDALDFVRNQWEASSLELHEARIEIGKYRDELAAALYRCESADKVIARLSKENDELRQGREAMATGANGSAMQDSAAGKVQLPEPLLEQARERCAELQTKRKLRILPATHPTPGMVGAYQEVGRVEVDGVITAAVLVKPGVLIAGNGAGMLYRIEKDTIAGSKKIFEGAVVRVRRLDDLRVVVAGSDRVCILDVSDWKELWGADVRGVVDVDASTLDGVLLVGQEDGQWSWRQITSGKGVVARGRGKTGMRCVAVHPDGMVFATAGESGVEMWDAAEMELVGRFDSGEGIVRDVVMSEKGYYMGVVRGDEVQIWDLRKRVAVGTLEVAGVMGCGFDDAGEFGCAFGGDEVKLFLAKRKARVVGQVSVGAGSVGPAARVGVAWDKDAGAVHVGGAGLVRRLSA